ncbi:MAG: MarC family protein [Pseudomonadota bacterium]
MDFSTLSLELFTTVLLLLLIGMGPKIALVPFIEKTKHLTPEMRVKVAKRMVTVGVATALVLFFAGALLLRLLHITSGAVAVAGGIVLALVAIKMALAEEETPETGSPVPTDPEKLAVYPLAVPYMLNPVGMTVLIVASEQADFAASLMVLGIVALVGANNWLVFTNIDKLTKRMRPTTLAVSEVVFGILLLAVGVQLIVAGLGSLGIIEASPHGGAQ